MVMGHEIAHALARHNTEKMGLGFAITIGFNMLAVALGAGEGASGGGGGAGGKGVGRGGRGVELVNEGGARNSGAGLRSITWQAATINGDSNKGGQFGAVSDGVLL